MVSPIIEFKKKLVNLINETKIPLDIISVILDNEKLEIEQAILNHEIEELKKQIPNSEEQTAE